MEGMLFSVPQDRGWGGVQSVHSVRSCFFISNINDMTADTLADTCPRADVREHFSRARRTLQRFIVSVKVSASKSLISLAERGATDTMDAADAAPLFGGGGGDMYGPRPFPALAGEGHVDAGLAQEGHGAAQLVGQCVRAAGPVLRPGRTFRLEGAEHAQQIRCGPCPRRLFLAICRTAEPTASASMTVSTTSRRLSIVGRHESPGRPESRLAGRRPYGEIGHARLLGETGGRAIALGRLRAHREERRGCARASPRNRANNSLSSLRL